MRTVIVLLYLAMTIWLLVAAALRIVLQLSGGQDLDPLPFISGALGLLGLVALAPAMEQRRQTRAREHQTP